MMPRITPVTIFYFASRRLRAAAFGLLGSTGRAIVF